MAIISKIRKHSALAIGVVGIAMASFVLSDLFKGNRGIPDLALIAGVTIDPRDFETRVQLATDEYKENSGQLSLDQSTIEQIRTQVWDQYLDEIIMGNEYKNIGLSVSPEEMFDLVSGKEPHASVVRAFSNPKTGQFNSADVLSFLKQMDSDPTGKSKARWLKFEQAIKKDRSSEKFYTLIQKGLYVTSKEAARDAEAKNKKANINYVFIRFTSIPDSSIAVSDNDLNEYYKENRYQFKQKPSRSVDYIVFDVLPTTDDTLDIRDWITRKTGEFRTTDNDTVFIASNADSPFEGNYEMRGGFPVEVDSLLFSSDTSGAIAGPYIEDGFYKVAKVMNVAMRPDSAKARHILIKPKSANDTTMMAKADSIINLLKNNGNFTMLALQLSEDQGSASNGGELGWFAEGTMVKPFNDSCFGGKKGDIKIVKSQFGVHVIEILDQKEPVKKIVAGIVDRKIEPSQKTFSAIYNKAAQFITKYNSDENFSEGAQKEGLDKRVAEYVSSNDVSLPGVEASREAVRWAFNAEKGMVSDIFECGNRFVVAHLDGINEDEYSTIDAVTAQVESGARNELKANKIIAEIKNNGDNNLEDLAKNLKQEVQSAGEITFATGFIPGIGREPALTGTIFNSNATVGSLQGPIKGRQGIFMISLTGFSEYTPPATLLAERQNLEQGLITRVEHEVFESLKDKAKIVDNRHLFY